MIVTLARTAAAHFGMLKIRPLVPIGLLVAVAALIFGSSTATAASRSSCAQHLLNDYFDGRIDNTYPVHCYREAINSLPEDILVYGDARNEITRALANAITDLERHGEPVTNATPIPGAGPDEPRHKKKKNIFAWVADKIGPGNASSIPLPLLILAGVGLLLVAAAAASYTSKRLAARRRPQPAPQPATSPPTPRRK